VDYGTEKDNQNEDTSNSKSETKLLVGLSLSNDFKNSKCQAAFNRHQTLPCSGHFPMIPNSQKKARSSGQFQQKIYS
jgi:hypothetical protein